jgi:hypothetical protein
MTDREKWVGELMESDRLQEQGRLRGKSGLSYCCLGVGCDVLGAEWCRDVEGSYYIAGPMVDMKFRGQLPYDVHDRLGLSATDETVLVELNDQVGMTLPEIGMFIMLCDLAGIPLTEGYTEGGWRNEFA